jgi:Heavy-metal resistance protein CzcE
MQLLASSTAFQVAEFAQSAQVSEKIVILKIFSMLLASTLIACVTGAPPVDFYGMAAEPVAAMRTIVIGPDTQHVNVEGGEIIRFVSGSNEFGWHFLVAASVSSFSLNLVAPPGLLDHQVRAYVSPDPKYTGGDGPDE